MSDRPDHLTEAIRQWSEWTVSFDDPDMPDPTPAEAYRSDDYILDAHPLGSITLDSDCSGPIDSWYFEILWAWQLDLNDELHGIKLIYLTRGNDAKRSTELLTVEADTYYSSVPTQWDKYNDALAHPTAECPEHGNQAVTGGSSTGGPDPYHIDHLACGHRVICMGPGEPYTIISG